MKTIETLNWILDNDNKRISSDEKYRLNIEFVHSLGLNCDCVGWSSLNLQNPRTDEILNAIDYFCKKNGWKARGVYTKSYADYTSDWYEIVPSAFKDNTLCGSEEYESELDQSVKVYNLQAYRELRPSPKWWHESILVPERFRNGCIRHNVGDVDFCWARDKGKYQSEQYFHLYCNNQIPTIAECKDITIKDRKRINALGGYLPKIADIFYRLQSINLQDCYIESDIPNCNIALAYYPSTYTHCAKHKFLIRSDFAQILIQEKAITKSDLMPAMVVKDLPNGYTLTQTVMPDRPKASCLQKSISKYEKLKNTERPLRFVPEKEALKILRIVKKERKEDFKKALSKNKANDIAKTNYAPILPYYYVTNGGYLSDEYEFLSFDDAVSENNIFAKELLNEELIEQKPDGVVFAKCSDGDKILLSANGKVIRFSHEEPIITEEWVSLAQFVADAVNE